MAKYIFTVFSYLCFFASTLRRWDKSAAIKELLSFLGIGTKHGNQDAHEAVTRMLRITDRSTKVTSFIDMSLESHLNHFITTVNHQTTTFQVFQVFGIQMVTVSYD